MAQRPAAQQFHDDKDGLGRVLFTEIEHGDDIRMHQAGQRLGFPQELIARGLLLNEMRRNDFEGDVALQAAIVGSVDNPHASDSDLLLNVIAACDSGSDHLVPRAPSLSFCSPFL